MTSRLTLLRRTLTVGMALAFALAGSLLADARPASAAVPGLVRVAATSAFDSVSPKFATATCPVGKVLVGTGYELASTDGEVVVDDFRSNGNAITAPTSLTVGAYEEDPVGTPWTVSAFALCANPVAGLVRVSASQSGSLDIQTATAICPVGKVMVGTGYELDGALGEVVVDDLVPNGNAITSPTAVFVGAHEADPNFLGSWTVTAYAICANPVSGLVRITGLGQIDSLDFKGVSARCPDGKVLLGAGFELNGVNGEAVVDDLRPNGSPTRAPTSVFVGAFEADPDFVPNWTADAYAICATQ